jgi:hypothetical protein
MKDQAIFIIFHSGARGVARINVSNKGNNIDFITNFAMGGARVGRICVIGLFEIVRRSMTPRGLEGRNLERKRPMLVLKMKKKRPIGPPYSKNRLKGLLELKDWF